MKKVFDVRIVQTEEHKPGGGFTRTIETWVDGRKWKIPPEVAHHIAGDYIREMMYEREREFNNE